MIDDAKLTFSDKRDLRRDPYRYQSGICRDPNLSASASRPVPGTVDRSVVCVPGSCEPPRRFSETQGESRTPARRPRDEAGRIQRRRSGTSRSRFASNRSSGSQLSGTTDARPRSNGAGNSEPRTAYNRLPLSRPARCFPVAIADNVDPQMPPERFLCQGARELDEKSSLLLQMESEGPKPGENSREFASLAG